MKKLVLIDGNALLHRAFHITPPLTTSSGELVNAVYGFTAMLIKVIDDEKPDYLTIAWDMRAPTFRKTQFEQYKANRAPADETLSAQYPRVFEIQKAFNIPEYKLPGFEADDLVGTLARQAEKKDKNLEIIIVTGDRDLMQLINSKIKVLMPKKTLTDVGLYGEEEFALRFGFSPIQLIDYKALAGDSSDNIPGVPGIGEVTATKLIQKYESFEDIYNHLEEIPERTRKLLEDGKGKGEMSKKLATIETSIPVKLDLKACETHDFDKLKVVKIFEELEFKSLLSRIPGYKPAEDDHSPSLNPDLKDSETYKLDRQLEPVLKKMSEVGVLIDKDFLDKFGKELKSKLEKIQKDIFAHIGHEFNLNSPKQLQEILFDELNLPVIKKTKTGRSTDEETLNQLADSHPVIPLLLQYRQLYKLVSTYIDALPKYIGEDSRIHSTFNVEGAATGRLSSTNPNLQNIPIKGEEGSELRKAFIVPKDKMLLGADYSQIELRILAHMADDPGLKKAFLEGEDIHATTASKIFNVPVSEVDKKQRMVGKTMNFATLYGQGPHALSRQLGVDYETARDYIASYFLQFPKVQDWMQKVLEQGYKDGYVETIWGRRRYIPELSASNKMLKAFGERAAINHPVQGTSADMIKKSMVEIDKKLKQGSMILTVHDELLFEVDPKDVESAGKIIKTEMENALKLSVPVKVELKSGPNWAEMKPLVI